MIPGIQSLIRKSWGISILFLFLSLGITYAETIPSERYDLSISKGIHAMNEGSYSKAINAFQKALDAKPQDVEATYYLSMAYRLSGQNQAALKSLLSVANLDPSIEQVYFDLGIIYYRLSQYRNALKALLKAETFSPQSNARQAMVQHNMGLNLMELKEFDKAAPRFLRVVPLSPILATRAHFFAGVSFYRQGVFDEAKDAFQKVISASPDSALAESSQKFLQEISRTAPKEKQWSLAASLGIHYDDNVIVLSEGSPLPAGISDKSDLRWVGRLRGALSLFRFPRSTGIARYSFYQSLHQDLDLFDAQNHDLGFSLKHSPSKWPNGFDFSYRFSNVAIDRKSYLRLHTLSIATNILSASTRSTRLSYRYQNKDFLKLDAFPGNEDRTGMNNAISLLQEWKMDEKNMTLHGAYTYDLENTDGKDWDYQGHSLKLGVSLPPSLFGGWGQPALGAEWGLKSYKNINTFSTATPKKKRKDQIQLYTVILSRPLSTWLSGTLQYLYHKNGSNVNLFEYDRQVVSLTMTVTH